MGFAHRVELFSEKSAGSRRGMAPIFIPSGFLMYWIESSICKMGLLFLVNPHLT